jgi:hypothetical protein
MGPARLQRQLVEHPVDALHLVDGHRIGAHPPLDLAKALVVGLLEGVERGHEFAERLADIDRGGAGDLGLVILDRHRMAPEHENG